MEIKVGSLVYYFNPFDFGLGRKKSLRDFWSEIR